MNNKEAYFYYGIISRRFSFKGEMLLKIDFLQVNLFSKITQLFVIDDNHQQQSNQLRPYELERIQFHKAPHIARIKLVDIDTEEANSKLLQKQVYLPLEILPAKKGRDFYYHEVIGFLVYHKNEYLGTIKEIRTSTPQPLFVIEHISKKEILIPLNINLISSVNRDSKQITLQLVAEGLVDLYLQ